jgi:hypothetical protein
MRRVLKVALLGAALWLGGCATAQVISQREVEEKVSKIILGQTTMAEVESLFGPSHNPEQLRWVYNLTDTAYGVAHRPAGKLSGMIPVAPVVAPTDTRALITLWFTEAGIVKGLEIARYFDPPFTNDYRYLIKDSPEETLRSVTRIGESSELHVAGADKGSGAFDLEDGSGKARIRVKFENQTLHITSRNSHDRLSTEFRVFAKRERAFTNRVATAEFIR